MPRKGYVPRRESAADPKYDSVLVTRFINMIMGGGKRSIAEGHFYKAMTMIEEKTGQEAMAVLKLAMNNVKPVLEVKSRRVGGANYQVPVEVRPERRNALATRWIISVRARPCGPHVRGEVRERADGGVAQRGRRGQEARRHAQDGGGQQGLRALPLVTRS